MKSQAILLDTRTAPSQSLNIQNLSSYNLKFLRKNYYYPTGNMKTENLSEVEFCAQPMSWVQYELCWGG